MKHIATLLLAAALAAGAGFTASTHIRIIYGCLKDREACINAVKAVKEALERHPKNQQ